MLAPAWSPVGGSPVYLWRAELDAWLDRLIDGAPVVPVGTGGLIGPRDFLPLRMSLLDVVRAVLVGGLNVAADRDGCFRVERLVFEERCRPKLRFELPPGSLGKTEIMDRLELGFKANCRVWATGLLKSHGSATLKHSWPHEVEEFRSRYVSFPELVRITGLSVNRITRIATLAGLTRVLPAPLEQFYLRAEAIDAFESHLPCTTALDLPTAPL